MKEQRQRMFELDLLYLWQEKGVESIYRHRNYFFESGSDVTEGAALFNHLNESFFSELQDATSTVSKPSDLAVPLVDLISARGGRQVTYRIVRPRKPSDAIDAPRMYVTGQAQYDVKKKQFIPTFTAKREEAIVLSTWAYADELNNRLLDELEIEITLGKEGGSAS